MTRDMQYYHTYLHEGHGCILFPCFCVLFCFVLFLFVCSVCISERTQIPKLQLHGCDTFKCGGMRCSGVLSFKSVKQTHILF